MQQIDNLLFLFRFLLQGAGVTIAVTLIALGLGFLLGTMMAVLRVYGSPFFSKLAATYSVVVRAIPVVVIIFVLFLVVARFVNLSAFLSGSLALGFASGAYQSEIFRGAIRAVPPGQMTAARAIGMSRLKAIRHVILPQALRLAIPSWTNEATLVLKDSTLVYVIGVPEILRHAQWVSANTGERLLAYSAAAAIYLLLTLIISRQLEWTETRYRLRM